MKEFKFRFWHFKNKKHYPVYSINFRTKTLEYIDEENEIDTIVSASFNEGVLEQHIGSKDINGIEIYENDVMAFDENTKENQQEAIMLRFVMGNAKPQSPLFKIVYNSNLNAFHKSLIFPPYERANHKYETIIYNGDVVIGNIHNKRNWKK